MTASLPAVLEHLRSIQFFMEMRDENPFKIRAFRAAREELSSLKDEQLNQFIKENRLTEIKGVGKGIAAVISEFWQTSTSTDFRNIIGDWPLSLLELDELSGLAPKRIRGVYEQLGISSLAELEYACLENRLVELPGFGQKTQEKLLKEIENLKARRGKVLLCDAIDETREFRSRLPKDTPFEEVGDLGMRHEVIETLEFLVEDKKSFEAKHLEKLGLKKSPSTRQVSLKTKHGHSLKFIHVAKASFPIHRVFLTSSPEHWHSLESAARKKTLLLTANELKKSDRLLKIESEQELYAELGIVYHPPEAREYAAEKSFEFVSLESLKGCFHAHSTYSDGSDSLKNMLDAAKAKGWDYFGISEHSQTAFYARGLKDADLQKQWKEIDQYNKKSAPFRVLKGVESDILKEGELDYPDKILKEFDFVIASIHQRYGLKEMTDRILAAVRNPYSSMIGHISGRLLLGREPYRLNYEAIIREAIATHTVIELNCNPHRLDMDWRYLRQACEAGLLISINPDAHSVEGLDDLEFGVWMARKALVAPSQIINTWPLKKLLELFSKQREKKAA
ncbi:MAG: hypothetical protein COV44_01200 [Deltaproteobacteria bacterium CG11_big_fil_rev_8_21_14_0_20_45_16]|nr:MAG: hypothetical protein COV44_01200 [Deltaproteobacteria bacterium CG11_big_fil_rev_8_21_14_0_20_45_16]